MSSSSVSNKSVKKSHFFRDSIGLCLIVYCTSFWIFYEYHSSGSITSELHNFWSSPDGLYLAGTLLINIGSIIMVLYDLIEGKPNVIVNIVCCALMIIGSLCYLIAFIMDIQHITGYKIAYYVGCLIFVSFKAIILASLILSDDSTPKSKVLTKSVVTILTAICMIYYWFNDYNSAFNKPTKTQYALIMAGWSIVMTISLGIIIYEANSIKNKAVAILFGVLISIGSVLLMIGSILYNVNGDSLQISSEWALSLSVFIASITTAISIGNNAKKRRKCDNKYNEMIDDDSVGFQVQL